MESDKELLHRFGQHLKKLREDKGISLNLFAFENDLSKSTISRIENGLVDPKFSTIYKISKSFEIPMDELMKF